MEKFIMKPYDKECMKMAMLKHEEMFREQVYELHRLYEIQKMLMKNISSNNKIVQNQDRRTNSKIGNCVDNSYSKILDLERPAEENVAEIDGNCAVEIEEEGQIELTLGPSSFVRRRKSETPLTSDSGLSFSSSSSGSSQLKRKSFSVYPNTDRRKEQLTGNKWGDSNPGFVNERRNSSEIQEQLRQDRLQQAPWLFQVLSLNMT